MRARKRFGQHFLQPEWADKVVRVIGPRDEDRFLEIGPGPGALTLRLASFVAHVTAVELDRDLAAHLRPLLPANVTLIEDDILRFDLASLKADVPFRIAGNLPYNVSAPILFRLLDVHRRGGGIADATLMVQREVADRLAAKPGGREYGVLSILVQLHADVEILLVLPPGAFRPPPKVHSAVVRLGFRAPTVPLADEAGLEAMVRSMFMQRRKTLRNALGPYAQSARRDAVAALASAGIDPRRRPETLQLSELARLADVFARG